MIPDILCGCGDLILRRLYDSCLCDVECCNTCFGCSHTGMSMTVSWSWPEITVTVVYPSTNTQTLALEWYYNQVSGISDSETFTLDCDATGYEINFWTGNWDSQLLANTAINNMHVGLIRHIHVWDCVVRVSHELYFLGNSYSPTLENFTTYGTGGALDNDSISIGIENECDTTLTNTDSFDTVEWQPWGNDYDYKAESDGNLEITVTHDASQCCNAGSVANTDCVPGIGECTADERLCPDEPTLPDEYILVLIDPEVAGSINYGGTCYEIHEADETDDPSEATTLAAGSYTEHTDCEDCCDPV